MVIWTIPAKHDLKKIYDYIAEDSQYYAKEVTEKIVELTTNLGTFSQKGRIVPELKKETIRELFFYSYRIIYEIYNGNIYIITILNMRKILRPSLVNKNRHL